MIELDHVLIAVSDLEAAAQEVERRHGLASVEGGRHQGLGTANRIVPLGDTYLGSSRSSTKPRRLRADSAAGWPAATSRASSAGASGPTTSTRYGLTTADGARARPDGTALRWRMAGVEPSAEEPSLPFFIEWGAETPYPGEALPQSAAIREVRLQGDRQRVAQWVGDANLPISVREGSPALESVVVDEAVLDPALWA